MPFEKYVPDPEAIHQFFQKVISGEITADKNGRGLPITGRVARPNVPVAPTRPEEDITYISPAESLHRYSAEQFAKRLKKKYKRQKKARTESDAQPGRMTDYAKSLD